MARRAGFEERFTVAGLFLAYLNQSFDNYSCAEGKISALYKSLSHLKIVLQESGDMESLRAFAKEMRSDLDMQKQGELIARREADWQEWAAGRLEAYDLYLKERHIREKREGMDCIRELFREDLKERQEIIEKIKRELEHAFRFIEDAFGEEQEMVLFVSGLSRSERAMEFISSHGCDAYFKYSEVLLYRKKEEEFRNICLKDL